MLKWQKKQIQDLLSTMEEAIKHNLYNDCIAGIQIIMKNFPNDGLDVLCADFINALLEVVKGNTEVNLLSRIEVLRLKISAIKCKKEVVFFPYQASMWDSFESVWEEFSKDDEYETFVVPIPYYDIDIKGNTGVMLYDGHNYPSNVKITDWKRYSLQMRNPDIAFIHNPYDGSNRVSRVEKEFYSSNIKKHCKKLVYIPYFVTNGNNTGEHLILTPAVFTSDYVIVDNATVKNNYLEHIKKKFKEDNLPYNHLYWTKKILPLGSPKIDAVVNKKFDFADLPLSWKQKICKQNGERRKIVFYNISLAAMLQKTLDGTDRYFKKVLSVFEYFKKQDDLVLLFRPHPLMVQSIKSMRPPFLPVYFNLIESFKSENIGIYDDSADLERALLISDCYYGDASSLMIIYDYSGKPVLIQGDFENFEHEVYTGTKEDAVALLDKYIENTFTNLRYCHDTGEITVPILMYLMKENLLQDFYDKRFEKVKELYPRSNVGTCGKEVYTFLKKG